VSLTYRRLTLIFCFFQLLDDRLPKDAQQLEQAVAQQAQAVALQVSAIPLLLSKCPWDEGRMESMNGMSHFLVPSCFDIL
jgi:hypothetical protein